MILTQNDLLAINYFYSNNYDVPFTVTFGGNKDETYENLIVTGIYQENGKDKEVELAKLTLEQLQKANVDYSNLQLQKSFILNSQIPDLESRVREKITGGKSHALVSHWNNQKIIAEKIIANTATISEIQAFQDEIDLRGLGETLQAFSERVLENSAIYTSKMCKITGASKKCFLAVEAAINAKDVQDAFDLLCKTYNNI